MLRTQPFSRALPLPVLALLCLMLLPLCSTPARAQGYWRTDLTLCKPDGTPILNSYNPLIPGYIALNGTWSGHTSSRQSLPPPYDTLWHTAHDSAFQDADCASFAYCDGDISPFALAEANGAIAYPQWIAADHDGSPFGPTVPIINNQQDGSSVSLSGSFLWKTQYIDPNGNPPPGSLAPAPPSSLTFLVVTSLSATHGRTASVLFDPSASASVQDDQFGEQVTLAADDLSPGKSGGGYHLVQVPVRMVTDSQGNAHAVYTVSLTGSLSAQASNVSATSGQAWAYATLNAKVAQDTKNRSVAISSDIDQSFYKGWNEDSVGWTQQAHNRNPDGSMAVDSVATYTNADWAYGGAWIASATFTAHAPGFTNPTYAWSSDFNPVQMVGVDLTQPTVTGGWLFEPGTSFPLTKTVTLTVTDGPTAVYPATGANTYMVTWHQPFEQWTDCQPAIAEEIDTIAPSSTPSGIPGSQVAYADEVFHCDFEFNANQMADGIVTAQKMLPATQPFFSPLYQALIAAAGQPFDKALLGVTTSHDVVNDSDAFTEATYLTTIGKLPLVPRDGDGNFQTHEKYKMVDGLLSAHYKKRFLKGDAYNIHGYAGPSPTQTARSVFKVQATGRYVFITNIGP